MITCGSSVMLHNDLLSIKIRYCAVCILEETLSKVYIYTMQVQYHFSAVSQPKHDICMQQASVQAILSRVYMLRKA